MVVDANTRVEPGTVVVKSLYTFVANRAVFRSLCPDNPTVRTKLGGMQFLH